MRPEMYIPRPHVRLSADLRRAGRPLGRAAAASPRPVERRRRRRRLDDRQWHLPHPRVDRAARGRRATVPAELGAGGCGDAVRGPHLCRARSAVPALGWHLRVHPRRVRPTPRFSFWVVRAADHPPRRLRSDLHHVVGVHATAPRARSGRHGGDRRRPAGARRAAPGRAVRGACGRRELRRDSPRRDCTEREHRVESRGPRPAGGAGLRAGGRAGTRGRSDARPASVGGAVAVPALDGGDPVGVRRVGRSRVRRRGGEGPAAQPAPGDGHRGGLRGGVVPRGEPGVPASHPDPAGEKRRARRGRPGPHPVGGGPGGRRFVGGEVKDPQRNLPRAMFIGTGSVVALYLAANLVYLHLIPIQQVKGAELVAADVARTLLGGAGLVAVSAAVAVSTFGTLNGSMMNAPPIFFAMAEDGVFPKAITRVDPRTGAPTGAIRLAGCLGALFVLVRKFTELADQFIIGIWPFYALAVAAGFVLRRRLPTVGRRYRTGGYPVVPPPFLLGALFWVGDYLVFEPLLFWLDVGVILLGIPAYVLWRRFARASTPPPPSVA